MDKVQEIIKNLVPVQVFPKFKSGDTVRVSFKIREGSKERIQKFQGIVLQRRGFGTTETVTVRKISEGIGVERIFPISSPFIDSIEVLKHGRVRRARIFYYRNLKGKYARIKDRTMAPVVAQ